MACVRVLPFEVAGTITQNVSGRLVAQVDVAVDAVVDAVLLQVDTLLWGSRRSSEWTWHVLTGSVCPQRTRNVRNGVGVCGRPLVMQDRPESFLSTG